MDSKIDVGNEILEQSRDILRNGKQISELSQLSARLFNEVCERILRIEKQNEDLNKQLGMAASEILSLKIRVAELERKENKTCQ